MQIHRLDLLFQTIDHDLHVPLIEISTAAIGVLNCVHSSQLVRLFLFVLKKSEDIIVKRNEEVTCLSCYLLANAVEVRINRPLRPD